MTKKNEKPSWLAGFTEEEIDEICNCNIDSFYHMKANLVNKRKSICSIEKIAEELKKTPEEMAEFEAYYSDPTLSQIRTYALAVGMKIHIEVEDCWKGEENDRED